MSLSKKFYFIELLWVIFLGEVYAVELPRLYLFPRPIGMGGAFTAVSNDSSAPWTNPAGISRTWTIRSRSRLAVFEFPTVLISLNHQGANKTRVLQLLPQNWNLEGIVDVAENISTETPFWGQAGMFPIIIFKPFSLHTLSLGGVLHTEMTMSMDGESGDLGIISDMGYVLGYAVANRTNRVNFGIQLRPLYRYTLNEQTIPMMVLRDKKELKLLVDRNTEFSSGVAVDMGFLYTFPSLWFPTVGISVFNLPFGCQEKALNPFSGRTETICGTVLSRNREKDNAQSTLIPMDMRLGFSVVPRIIRGIDARLSFDFHHVPVSLRNHHYGLDGLPFEKLFHAGLEVLFERILDKHFFSLSTGFSHGYQTFGINIRMPLLTLELASYTGSLSVGNKEAKSNPRYILKTSIYL